MLHPSLLNDILFKIVFGTQQNEAILRALLNAILGYSGSQRITQVALLNPFNEKEYVDERGVILDIKARDAQGRHFNVEVQLQCQNRYVDRSLYYAAQLLVGQLDKGQPYTDLAPTIGISLLDFILFPEHVDVHSVFELYDVDHKRMLSDRLELHYIELPKFSEKKPHNLRSPFEKWLHVLKYAELYERGKSADLPAELQEEEGINMALDAMNRAYARDEVRELIEARLAFQRDEATRMVTARQEGRQEGQLLLARKMVKDGIPLEAICQSSGFSREELLSESVSDS